MIFIIQAMGAQQNRLIFIIEIYKRIKRSKKNLNIGRRASSEEVTFN